MTLDISFAVQQRDVNLQHTKGRLPEVLAMCTDKQIRKCMNVVEFPFPVMNVSRAFFNLHSLSIVNQSKCGHC